MTTIWPRMRARPTEVGMGRMGVPGLGPQVLEPSGHLTPVGQGERPSARSERPDVSSVEIRGRFAVLAEDDHGLVVRECRALDGELAERLLTQRSINPRFSAGRTRPSIA